MLEKRANALKKGKFTELEGIEKEMTLLKNSNYEEFNTPNYMWVVFMHDIGVQAAFEQETF